MNRKRKADRTLLRKQTVSTVESDLIQANFFLPQKNFFINLPLKIVEKKDITSRFLCF